MQYLGPLSSTSGSRIFYVDISPQLDTSESLSTINVSTDHSSISISSSTILSSDLTTKAGTTLSAGKSMSFRASCSGGSNDLASIIIDYTTDASNRDKTVVKLKLVPEII